MKHQTVCENPECAAWWYKKLETDICPLCGQKTLREYQWDNKPTIVNNTDAKKET